MHSDTMIACHMGPKDVDSLLHLAVLWCLDSWPQTFILVVQQMPTGASLCDPFDLSARALLFSKFL